MPLKIGLTGGIGSGKTTIAKMFEALGIPVYYADNATKELYQTDSILKEKLIQTFGDNTYLNGIFNPQYLRDIVFNDPEKLEQLNQIVHPATIQDAQLWLNKQTAPYVIKEAALIFESGSQRDLDLTIGVTAPLEIRINRVINRDGLTKQEILARMSRQIDDNIKMRLCDEVLLNDDKTPLLPQVLALHEKLLIRANQQHDLL